MTGCEKKKRKTKKNIYIILFLLTTGLLQLHVRFIMLTLYFPTFSPTTKKERRKRKEKKKKGGKTFNLKLNIKQELSIFIYYFYHNICIQVSYILYYFFLFYLFPCTLHSFFFSLFPISFIFTIIIITFNHYFFPFFFFLFLLALELPPCDAPCAFALGFAF